MKNKNKEYSCDNANFNKSNSGICERCEQRDEEIKEILDDVVGYIFERVEEKLKDFKIEFKEELKKQTEEILIGSTKIADNHEKQ